MNAALRSLLKWLAAAAIGAGLFAAGVAVGRAGWSFPGGRFAFGMMREVAPFGLGGILAVVPTILWWGLILVAVVWLVSSFLSRPARNRPPDAAPMPESALEILRTRYARGEISKDQYEEMRRDLTA